MPVIVRRTSRWRSGWEQETAVTLTRYSAPATTGSHANSICAVGPQEWRGVSKTGCVAQLVSMPSRARALSPGRVR